MELLHNVASLLFLAVLLHLAMRVASATYIAWRTRGFWVIPPRCPACHRRHRPAKPPKGTPK